MADPAPPLGIRPSGMAPPGRLLVWEQLCFPMNQLCFRCTAPVEPGWPDGGFGSGFVDGGGREPSLGVGVAIGIGIESEPWTTVSDHPRGFIGATVLAELAEYHQIDPDSDSDSDPREDEPSGVLPPSTVAWVQRGLREL